MFNRADKSAGHQPDSLRRKVLKGGLATPVILATLASKPVLGATAHNCTISGQVSGNVSTHEQGDCNLLGHDAAYWIALWSSGSPPNWPDQADFFNAGRKNTLAGARDFSNTPYSKTQFISNAFKVVQTGTATTRNATILEVLLGYIPQYSNDFVYSTVLAPSPDLVLTSTRPERFDLTLGKEVVAAYLNSIDPILGYSAYPVAPADIVSMFNSIAQTGTCSIGGSTTWNGSQLLAYLTQLHS